MIFEIIIPDLGGTDEVTLDEWLVQPGAFVKAGTPLVTVTTAKATQEIEAFRDGYLLRSLAGPGAVLELGSAIALLGDTPDETGAAESTVIAPIPEPLLAETRSIPLVAGAPAPKPLSDSEGRIQASPLARRLARELGVDLAKITGSGPQGQLLKRDVLRATASRPDAVQPHTAPFVASLMVDVTEAVALLAQVASRYEKQKLPAPTLTALAAFALGRLLEAPAVIGVVVGLTREDEPIVLRDVRSSTVHDITMTLLGTAPVLKNVECDLVLLDAAFEGLDAIAVSVGGARTTICLGAPRAQPALWQGAVAVRTLMTASIMTTNGSNAAAAQLLKRVQSLLENPLDLVFRF